MTPLGVVSPRTFGAFGLLSTQNLVPLGYFFVVLYPSDTLARFYAFVNIAYCTSTIKKLIEQIKNGWLIVYLLNGSCGRSKRCLHLIIMTACHESNFRSKVPGKLEGPYFTRGDKRYPSGANQATHPLQGYPKITSIILLILCYTFITGYNIVAVYVETVIDRCLTTLSS